MTIQQQIKNDLKEAMKARDGERKDALRVIMGEFARLENKEVADDEVVRILRKLVKAEKEVLAHAADGGDSRFVKIVESYLPQMADDGEIRAWIEANVDFSAFKNRMQAMGSIMKHFGSRADGNRVRTILADLPE